MKLYYENLERALELHDAGKAQELATWLQGLPSVTWAMPLKVTIGKIAYHGARYVQGTRPALYLLGQLPPSYKTKAVYQIENGEWYVAGYWQGGEGKEHHPYGPHFLLMPWTHPGEKIDHYDRKPRKRMKVEVEYPNV